MITQRRYAGKNAGFTLLEVMMASSLLMVVLGMLYGPR